MTGRWLLSLFAVFCFAHAHAGEPAYEVGVRPMYGFLIAHRPSMVHLVNEHVTATELFIQKRLSRSDKAWHSYFNRPDHGIALWLGSLGNDGLLGKGIGIAHYANVHFIQRKKFEWNFRLGMGLGYMTKTFERMENNKNNAIGSHLNGMMTLQTQVLWKGKHFSYGSGIALTHYSNGAYKMPNLGLNIPTFFLSAQYRLKPRDFEKELETLTEHSFQKDWQFAATWFGALREINPPAGKKYFVTGFESFATRHFSKKSSWLAGLDVIYNSALPVLYERLEQTNMNHFSFTQLGLNAGWQLNMDELKFSVQMGAYLISRYKEDGPLYHRICLRYFFPNNLIAHFALKTHFAKADYLEFGVGYRFVKGVNK